MVNLCLMFEERRWISPSGPAILEPSCWTCAIPAAKSWHSPPQDHLVGPLCSLRKLTHGLQPKKGHPTTQNNNCWILSVYMNVNDSSWRNNYSSWLNCYVNCVCNQYFLKDWHAVFRPVTQWSFCQDTQLRFSKAASRASISLRSGSAFISLLPQ